MSQNTKSFKGAKTQARKRKNNAAAEQKIAEPPLKRGRSSKLKDISTPSPAGTSKKTKTIQKTPEVVKEHTPVTPTESPPSADAVPTTTSNKKNTKKQKQLQTPRRSNPPREASKITRALQLQRKTVAFNKFEKPKLRSQVEKSRPRVKHQGILPQKKHKNEKALQKNTEQLFQPEADVAVVDYGSVAAESLEYAAAANNNNEGYLLAEGVDMQYFYV